MIIQLLPEQKTKQLGCHAYKISAHSGKGCNSLGTSCHAEEPHSEDELLQRSLAVKRACKWAKKTIKKMYSKTFDILKKRTASKSITKLCLFKNHTVHTRESTMSLKAKEILND